AAGRRPAPTMPRCPTAGGHLHQGAREAATDAATSTAYQGPGPLTATSALTAWTADIPALLVVVVAAVAYCLAIRSLRATGRSWSAGRTAAFACGLALVVLATCSAV